MIDVKRGRAVLARGGDRAHYAPVKSILHEDADPLALALAYRDKLGRSDLYLADLDAIAGGPPALPLLRAIADLGMAARIDAGIRSSEAAAPLLDAGASEVVAGLETLEGPKALTHLVARFGPDRIVFSLDLKAGRPLVATRESWGTDSPRDLSEIAVEIGIRRLILLDLAKVGTGSGVGTEPLLRSLKARFPTVEIAIGGGISGPDDLRSLKDAGASAALVGSALHDGRIGASAIAIAEG